MAWQTVRSQPSDEEHPVEQPFTLSDSLAQLRSQASCHVEGEEFEAGSTRQEGPAGFARAVGWPTKAEELGKSTLFTRVSHAAECILLLAPMIFIGLGIAIVAVSKQPVETSKFGQRLEAAVKLGPTLFPLLFAAVATRSLKILGRYLSQRVTKLGTLELLLASRSVWGTIESQVLLRRCTVVGIQLLLLWSLSPLGGQASLRALVRTVAVTRNTTALRYLHTGAYATFLVPKGFQPESPTTVFVSVLMASQKMKTAPRDNWGNVRVPRLDLLPSFGACANTSNSSNSSYSSSSSSSSSSSTCAQWHTVPHITTPEQYASLTGVPIVGLPAAGSANVTADFTLETSYMSLSCGPWAVFPASDGRLADYTRMWKGRDPFRHIPGYMNDQTDGPDTTFYLDTDMPSASQRNASVVARDRRPRHLFFGSASRTSNDSEKIVSATKCAVTEAHVEVAVACTGGRDCTATRVRRSQADTRPASGTPLDYATRRDYIALSLPRMEQTDGRQQSDVEFFLADSLRPVLAQAGAPAVRLADVPPRVFARRLQLVLNTWYLATLVRSGQTFYGDVPASPAAYGFDFARLPADGAVNASVVNAACQHFCTRGTAAAVAHAVAEFSFSRLWLALLLGSAGALLAVGLAGAIVGRRTHVPDMFGYVASMTYNNRFFRLPGGSGGGDGDGGGGVLDAMHRTRILRHVRVTVSDVSSGNDSVGRIAFTAHGFGRALEKKKLYS